MPTSINKKLVCQLALFHIAIIALANYTVQFTGTLQLANTRYDFTWGMFVFPLVILATDLTVRLSNQQNARIIVAIAYIPAIAISVWLADWRIGIASGSAYLLGQLLDITVFQKIRNRSTHWWSAPLISTFFANIIDTYTFYSTAFYHSTDPFMSQNWLELANVDLTFKIIVSILVFLPIYGVLLNYLRGRLATNG